MSIQKYVIGSGENWHLQKGNDNSSFYLYDWFKFNYCKTNK
ncbi:hypothetical protein SAMN00777080_4986 [Aquiflexum balticum DSM 16537]|uniref:Uncharacterized protein n=1 Tax=Aquiflexum balticum DSM 16537 TaxID=758820 RepID=A0A1W2HBQ6_9BACT|nr:hypothetical protein SAMN00777080_4986 [Aquiflexum balticum DSM 16537]